MRRSALVLLASVAAHAAVTGTVTNRTSGKPQGAATVTIYKLGGAGPESLETVKSGADGSFTLNVTPAGAPHMIQTAYDGLTYTKMLPPGSPTEGVQLEVFSSSPNAGAAQVTTHMMLFEPDGMSLNVSESYVFTNDGNTTFNNPQAGTLRFFLPPDANGKVKVMATGPQSVPIERPAEPAGPPGIYKVDFPIKPGKTQIELSWAAKMTGPTQIPVRILHGSASHIVAPSGVTITGDGLELKGTEPNSQASVFFASKKDLTLTIDGVGALRDPEPAEDDEAPGIQTIRPRVYERVLPLLGLAALLFGLGFALMYRKQALTPQPAPPAAAKPAKKK